MSGVRQRTAAMILARSGRRDAGREGRTRRRPLRRTTEYGMANDPYTVLGVARTASDEDIRQTYRRLAKSLHPDLNPNDRASAEQFKRVTAAYDILGDSEKRRQFDTGQIDANGEPRRNGYRARTSRARADAGEFGFGDIFSDIFGRGTTARGADVRYTLDVSFLEAALGTKKRVTMPDGGALDLTVPAGVEHGQVLRLRGKGAAAVRGADAGDALVEIRVSPHAEFKRKGLDVESRVPITIDEAVLGGKIEVPIISGRVQLTIPKGTNSGRVFRLKGKGIVDAGGRSGDALITVEIVLPPVIDDTLAYFLSEWRQKNKYNPGRG
jgi:DnaJ-class molecular chaperone